MNGLKKTYCMNEFSLQLTISYDTYSWRSNKTSTKNMSDRPQLENCLLIVLTGFSSSLPHSCHFANQQVDDIELLIKPIYSSLRRSSESRCRSTSTLSRNTFGRSLEMCGNILIRT